MHNKMVVIALGLSTSTLIGCAIPQGEQPLLDCTNLHQVASAASEDFVSISGQQEVTRYGKVARAKLHPFGSCSVLVLAAEPPVYMCSSKSSSQQSDSALLVAEVEQCLGEDWERTELAGGGASFEKSAVQVSVGKTDRQASGDSSVGLTVQRR